MKFRLSWLLAIAFIGMTCVSSCVKDYTCVCKISYSGQPGLPDTLTQTYRIKDTKSKAKSNCEANSGTYNNNGINTVEHCYLF